MLPKTTLEKVQELHRLFLEGKIPTLPQHEVHPDVPKDSRENYLYFTLPPSLNFQRNSPAMWTSAMKTYEDPETNYLFFPEKVVLKSREEIQRDLVKHKLALQQNKHTDIWIAISRAFHEFYADDPRELFQQHEWDVLQILQLLQIDKKKDFPYLSGPKMANYWMYILSHYTDASFKNMHEISIIPDTHVLQCTVQLGLSKDLPDSLVAAQLWKELLKDSDITPVEMHPVLWNWSRNNFLPAV